MKHILSFLFVSFFLISLSYAQASVEGFPNQVCGQEAFSTTYPSTSSTTMLITSSTSNVIVSPTTVTYTANNSPDISIDCIALGPVELTFTVPNFGVVDTVRFFCSGLINVINPPINVLRGTEFELDVTLSPTPVESVNLIVESLSPLITPGSERIVFGIEQSLSNEIFFVPEGNIGEAEILFRSRSLRDYNGPNCDNFSFKINVQGSLSSTINGQQIGTGETISVTINVDIPTTFDQIITISSLSGIAPQNITLPARHERVTFDFTVTSDAFTDGCITYSSQFYQTVTECFEIAGVFSVPDLIDPINVFTVESFTLVVNPVASFGDLIVSVTTTDNISVFSTITIPFHESSELFQVDGLEAGNAWIEFQASGYITKKIFFDVVDIQCDESDEILSLTGFECLTCPRTNDIVCSNNGICSTSLIAIESARCICNDDFFGPQCEFTDDSIPPLQVEHFGISGLVFTTEVIPSTYLTTITIPDSLIQDGSSGMGSFYIQPFDPENPFLGSFDPATTMLPIPDMEDKESHILPIGFNFDVTASDNTLITTLTRPVEFFFEFDRTVISQKEFIQMELYYWMSGEWVPASTICPLQFHFEKDDLIHLTTRTNLCRSGQYQFFQIAPIPAHAISTKTFFPPERFVFDDLSVYYSNTGFGVVSTEEPPQPTFTDPNERPVVEDDDDDDDDDNYATEPIKVFSDISFESDDSSTSYDFDNYTTVRDDDDDSSSAESIFMHKSKIGMLLGFVLALIVAL